MSSQLEGTQPNYVCCCGVRNKNRPQLRTVTDGGDEVDGGNNIVTCICCWFMGCDEEGVYVWLKNLLLLYNLIFWLLSCCLLSLGIYSEVMRQRFTDADPVLVTPSVILLTIGTFSFVFANIGGIGALRDNVVLLKIFIFSILFFLVAELACGVLALIFKEPAKDFVNVYVRKGLTTYYDDPDLKDVVDYIQEEFQCCGGQTYRDWEVNPYHNCSAPGPTACGVPYSCCVEGNGSLNINSMCGYDTIQLEIYVAADYVYTNGCITAVLDFLWLNLNVVAGVLLGIFVPQITGLYLGFLYLSQIRRVIDTIRGVEFSQMTAVKISPLPDDQLTSDGEGNKRYSYPLYLHRPSLIEENVTPVSSVRSEKLKTEEKATQPLLSSEIQNGGTPTGTRSNVETSDQHHTESSTESLMKSAQGPNNIQDESGVESPHMQDHSPASDTQPLVSSFDQKWRTDLKWTPHGTPESYHSCAQSVKSDYSSDMELLTPKSDRKLEAGEVLMRESPILTNS